MDFNIPSPLRVPIAREDLLTLISTSDVLAVWYKITDAIDGTVPIYVVGELPNTLRRTAIKEDVSGNSYQYGTYTIGTTGNQDDVFTAIGASGSVASVTGESVDNTDTANPVVNAWPLAGTGSDLANGAIEVDPSHTGDLIFQDNGSGNIASIEFVAGGVAIRNADANGDAVLSANAGGEAFLGTVDPSANRAYFKTLINVYTDAATYPVISEINNKRIQFDGQGAPSVNDDGTLGYAIDSFWIYNGGLYICSDASTGAAVWVQIGSGGAFIPLAGTTMGNPVTGKIVVDPAFSGELLEQSNGFSGFLQMRFVGNADLFLRHISAGGAESTVNVSRSDEAYISFFDGVDTADFLVGRNTFSDAVTYPVVNFVNEKRYQFNGVAAPAVTDDNTRGYGVNSYWVYAGVIYICTNAATGAAVWVSAAGTPVVPIVSLTRAALQALISGSTLNTGITYRVTDATVADIVIDVWAATSNTLQSAMIDQTNTRFGFYNITGDTFTEVYIPAISSPAQGDLIYRNGSGAWTRLPAGTAGQVLQTNGVAAPSWINPWIDVPFTGSDFTTTSATAVDVTGLSFPVAANSTYTALLLMRAGCSGVGGYKIGYNFPASTTVGTNVIGRANTTTTQNMFATSITVQTLGATQYSADANDLGFILVSLKIVTGGTAGTFQIQGASSTGGQTSTYYTGSTWMMYRKTA